MSNETVEYLPSSCPKCGGQLDTGGRCYGVIVAGPTSVGLRAGCGYSEPIPISPKKMNLNEVEHFLFDEEVSWKEKYEKLVSGDYGAFELWGSDGEIDGYRGFRKNRGTTEIYPSYREAIEAALEEFSEEE